MCNLDELAGAEFTTEDGFGEWIFDVLFDGATKWTGTEVGVVTFFDEEVLGGLIDLEGHVAFFETLENFADFVFDDAIEVVAVERTEDNDVVETVDEFRTEVTFDFDVERLLHLLVIGFLGLNSEAEACLVLDEVCTDV